MGNLLNPAGTVVFMGAGASRAFGLPLTDQILPKIVERLERSGGSVPQLFPGAEQARLIEHLRHTLVSLHPGLTLATAEAKDLPNITNVLSLLDHLILHEQPSGLRFRKPELLLGRRLLERAMMEVLLDVDLSPVTHEEKDLEQYEHELLELPGVSERSMTGHERQLLDRFLDWLLREAGRPLSIVTTNYDVAVETALFRKLGPANLPTRIDFGFDWRHPFREVLIPRPSACLGTPAPIGLYKLHGSFNWLRCDLCDQLYVNPLEVIAYLSFNEQQVRANTCSCGAWPLRHLIVAPSMVRDIRDPHLLNVWRNATEALRTAAEWYIIGYSLPAEDLAIRSMLLRAFHARGLEEGPSPLAERPGRPGPRVTVVQKGAAARPTYATMFRESDFTYRDGGLEELLAHE